MSDSNPGGIGKLWEAVERPGKPWGALGRPEPNSKPPVMACWREAANSLERYVAKQNQPKGALLRGRLPVPPFIPKGHNNKAAKIS